jgi:predicted lipoprotein with Yx(FWY)xxD motif
MRKIILIALSGLLVSACEAGTETLETTTTAGQTTTTAGQTTTTAGETTTTAGETTTTAGAVLEGAAVATADSELGTIVVDGEGLTLYILTADEQGASTCYDDCAGAWPPFTTDGGPQAEAEVDASLLGTTDRDDGTTQVTYDGWPLYYFIQDAAPGDVTGQGIVGFGGTWWVIGPDGVPIEEG